MMELARGLFLLVPIAILFSVGGLIALNSGTNQPNAGYVLRRLVVNLGTLVVYLALALGLLMMAQQSVGLGLGLGR
jgi:hypothetical protein